MFGILLVNSSLRLTSRQTDRSCSSFLSLLLARLGPAKGFILPSSKYVPKLLAREKADMISYLPDRPRAFPNRGSRENLPLALLASFQRDPWKDGTVQLHKVHSNIRHYPSLATTTRENIERKEELSACRATRSFPPATNI
jgi:hypothetical protein